MPSFRCLSCVWEGFEYFVLYLYIKRLQSWKCASLCEQIYLTFNKLLILPSFPLLSGMQNNKGCKATHSLKRANENNDIAIYSLSLSLSTVYIFTMQYPSFSSQPSCRVLKRTALCTVCFCLLQLFYTHSLQVLYCRAKRAFLQALRVTRACVLSFPLRVPRSRVLFQSFFLRTKIRILAFQIL